MATELPADAPPERTLEMRERAHDDGVDVLGVEARVVTEDAR